MHTTLWLKRIVILAFVVTLLHACATPPPPPPPVPPLRVGVVRDYPPLVYRMSDSYSGAEVEMARLLSRETGRPLQFVERGFDDLIPALLAREIDIIMAGMTITAERKVRIDFTDYYLRSGLAVAMRMDKADEFGSLEKIIANAQTVGVVGGTVAEAYVRRTFPASIRIILLGKPSDAPFELKNRRIDVYVDDAPSIAWLISSDASEVRGLFEPLSVAYYGWGVSKDNIELSNQANAALTKWKRDGILDRVLDRWVPSLKNRY